jgi:uncharacterized zinc-type alcohol dehydrogenase-like protein
MLEQSQNSATRYLAKAFAAPSATAPLALASIPRRAPGPRDIQIEILYCGVCHSDLHQVRDEWHDFFATVYPCVPGHEIVGRVVAAGSAVRKLKEGDIAAVGCMVSSCGKCPSCLESEQQFCETGATFTYNAPDAQLGAVTYGGYSDSIVVDEGFALRVSPKLDLASAAPLLCAGITTYSPLRRARVGKDHRVGVVGLGGLGHMAVKFARAFGAQVVLFTTSPGKVEDALRLGAHEVVVSRDAEAMKKHADSLDFVLDTVSGDHDVNQYLNVLRRDGRMTLVGAPEKPLGVSALNLLFGRKQLAGSIIGGVRETQEMLDFCAEHGITADIELIRIQDINAAYQRLLQGDVKYRFVIDMASLK